MDWTRLEDHKNTTASMSSNTWTRLIRFIASDGEEYFGEPVEGLQDVGLAYSRGEEIEAYPVGGDVLGAGAVVWRDRKVRVSRLLAPLSASMVGTIRLLGANFAAPGAGAGAGAGGAPPPVPPVLPIVFYKPLTALSGPGAAIPIPACAAGESDYEAELVVVLGADAKDVPAATALDYVAAYTLANDISARKRMFAVPQWGLGKSFDHWLPLGPCLVHPSRLDPRNVSLATTLNGAQMQNGNTAHMLWHVADTIAELSKGTTLQKGSIISMYVPSPLPSVSPPPSPRLLTHTREQGYPARRRIQTRPPRLAQARGHCRRLWQPRPRLAHQPRPRPARPLLCACACARARVQSQALICAINPFHPFMLAYITTAVTVSATIRTVLYSVCVRVCVCRCRCTCRCTCRERGLFLLRGRGRTARETPAASTTVLPR